MRWLHVSRVNKSATHLTIANNIKGKIPNINKNEIMITEMASADDCKSFKVGIDSKFATLIEDTSLWADYIFVR